MGSSDSVFKGSITGPRAERGIPGIGAPLPIAGIPLPRPAPAPPSGGIPLPLASIGAPLPPPMAPLVAREDPGLAVTDPRLDPGRVGAGALAFMKSSVQTSSTVNSVALSLLRVSTYLLPLSLSWIDFVISLYCLVLQSFPVTVCN